ncbi:M23 family metallopeptidase [Micromonospora sp. NBC_01638]|nr:M23 family metallopeptidase [Micromonospora sp. NBC_01638]
MQNENTPDTAQTEQPQRGGRRNRLIVLSAAALVALGLGGVAVATTGNDHPAPAAVSLDAQSRAEAASRADRSARESSTPVAPAASPTPSPSAASASPTPTKTATAKAKPKPKATKPTPAWVDPMPGAAVTSCYGQRWGTLHAGIDLALPSGTPIRAAAAGTVTQAGDASDGYGNSVFIDHGNGYLTNYAHQSRVAVAVGQKVKAGQVIGYEGATGDSTGPHLHFEVHQGMWNQIDPAPFMRAHGVDLGC